MAAGASCEVTPRVYRPVALPPHPGRVRPAPPPYAPDMSDSTPASAAGSSAADLAALRAAAAQAAAEAAEAKAQAAAAALAAAEAAAAGVDDPPPAAAPPTSSHAAEIIAGYTFSGPMLPLGALVEDDVPVPGAVVGIPLAMMNRHGLVAGATGTGKTKTLQVLAEGL